MEILGDMGDVQGNIVVTTKYATRDQQQTDGRDRMKAIGKDGKFDIEMGKDLKLTIKDTDIWQWKMKQRPILYAVCHKEIKSVHNDFCNHNKNIDHVLLNTGTREDLIEQMTNIINFYSKI
jgi:hypothetical protein